MAKTLRDEFAMAAMQGMHAADTDITKRPGRQTFKECATAAYEMANAMMKERLKHNTVEDTTR